MKPKKIILFIITVVLMLSCKKEESKENDTDISQKIDKFAGNGVGAEYFFDKHFSIGVEAQGNVTVSDMNSFRFGNPDGTNFNTATMVTANVYF